MNRLEEGKFSFSQNMQYQMYYCIDKLSIEKFMRFDFTINFGISPDVRQKFIELLASGGNFEDCAREFAETPTIMLLKLHKYLNWADKKLHSHFFLENKD